MLTHFGKLTSHTSFGRGFSLSGGDHPDAAAGKVSTSCVPGDKLAKGTRG